MSILLPSRKTRSKRRYVPTANINSHRVSMENRWLRHWSRTRSDWESCHMETAGRKSKRKWRAQSKGLKKQLVTASSGYSGTPKILLNNLHTHPRGRQNSSSIVKLRNQRILHRMRRLALWSHQMKVWMMSVATIARERNVLMENSWQLSTVTMLGLL